MQHPNSNRLYGTANFREVAKQDREAVPCPISAAEGLKILRDSRPLGTGGRRGRASRPAGNTRRRGSRRIATAARGAPPTDGDHPEPCRNLATSRMAGAPSNTAVCKADAEGGTASGKAAPKAVERRILRVNLLKRRAALERPRHGNRRLSPDAN